MRLSSLTSILAGTLVLAACDRGPTQPPANALALDAWDPYVLTFDATAGLPEAPFHMPGMPGGPMMAREPGARFPDALKLTDAQVAAISALRQRFDAATAADMAALKAIHDRAQAAIKSGASRADVMTKILAAAKPILDHLKPMLDALHTAVFNVLTAEQKAWIEAHRPTAPPGPAQRP